MSLTNQQDDMAFDKYLSARMDVGGVKSTATDKYEFVPITPEGSSLFFGGDLDVVKPYCAYLGCATLVLGAVYELFVPHGYQSLFTGYLLLVIPMLFFLYLETDECFEMSSAWVIIGATLFYTSDPKVGIAVLAVNFLYMAPYFYEAAKESYPELYPLKPSKEGINEIINRPDPVLVSGKATAEDIEKELQRLRSNFRKFTHLRDYKFRMAAVEHVNKGFAEMREEFENAVRADLGGDANHTFLNHLMFIPMECQEIRRNLKVWMKRQSIETAMTVAPAKSYNLHQPLGVIGVFGCWNYPTALVLQPVLEALAAGNCCIVKLSEIASNTEKVLAKLFARYLHPHFFSCVVGGPAVAVPFSKMKVDKMFFTGGWTVARHIYKACAENLVPVVLELGGKNPVVIAPSAHLETAAIKIATTAFINAGQLCLRPDTVFVPEAQKKEFVKYLKEQVQKQWGDNDAAWKDGCFGRIISEASAKRLSSWLEEEHGGEVVLGGNYDVAERYVAPTVIVEPNRDSTIAKNEAFGPVCSIFGYKDASEVYDLMLDKRSSLEKPLAMYYFGKADEASKKDMQENMSAGTMCVNECVWQAANSSIGFGGVGMSGQGAYHGYNGFKTFSHTMGVMEKAWKDVSMIGTAPFETTMPILKFVQSHLSVFILDQWTVIKRAGLGCLVVVTVVYVGLS